MGRPAGNKLSSQKTKKKMMKKKKKRQDLESSTEILCPRSKCIFMDWGDDAICPVDGARFIGLISYKPSVSSDLSAAQSYHIF